MIQEVLNFTIPSLLLTSRWEATTGLLGSYCALNIKRVFSQNERETEVRGSSFGRSQVYSETCSSAHQQCGQVRGEPGVCPHCIITLDSRKCVWEHGQGGDRRRDDEFKSFSEFRNSLSLSCQEDSEPALLQVWQINRDISHDIRDNVLAGDPQCHVAWRGLLQQLLHPLHGLEDSHRGQL